MKRFEFQQWSERRARAASPPAYDRPWFPVSEPYQAAQGRNGSIRLMARRQREQNGALQVAQSVNYFVYPVTVCLNAGGELELANRGTNMPNTAPVVHSDPDILGGTPVFVGTRVPFRNLIDYLERNHSLEEFLDSFPSVSREQAVASLEAAHEALSARAHSA